MLTVDIKLMITYIALIYAVNCMDTLLPLVLGIIMLTLCYKTVMKISKYV